MTKDEFLKKYLGYTVYYAVHELEVWDEYTESSKTINSGRGLLLEVKDRMKINSKITKNIASFRDPISFFLYEGDNHYEQLRLDKSYRCAEFIKDFISFCDLCDNETVDLLFNKKAGLGNELKKINEPCDRVALSNMKSIEEVKTAGFINGYTNTKISLWWSIEGRRILFARGVGVFELF